MNRRVTALWLLLSICILLAACSPAGWLGSAVGVVRSAAAKAGAAAASGTAPGSGASAGSGAASASAAPSAEPPTATDPTHADAAATPPAAAQEPIDPVQALLDRLTPAQKVGQLVIAGMDGTEPDEQARELIGAYQVGGFIFYKDNLAGTSQALRLFNSLKQANAGNPVPLWMSVDEEGGRVSRLPDEFVKFPTNRTIGRVDSTDLSAGIGRAIGGELSAFGLNMDFAPVLDVNSNPNNPVIGNRSFGADAGKVSRLGIATMQGLQAQKVVPVVKHFPGHGDTSVDSHIGLPVVDYDLDRLRKLELVPFADAVQNGADAVMIGHLLLPKLDPDHPASFSRRIISDLLRKELGFTGVVITDDMTMGAVEQHYALGESSVESVLAGSNIILVGHDYAKEITVLNALNEAAANGRISQAVLDERVYGVLKLKLKYGLSDEAAKGPDVEAVNTGIRDLLAKYGLGKPQG